MARLPSGNYLVQQSDGHVVVFEDVTEREVLRFPVLGADGQPDGNGFARAQKVIYDDPWMTDEDKCFAHFWCGYFWAHASGP